MDIFVIKTEPIVRDNNAFASIVGFDIGGTRTKIRVHDEFVTQRKGHPPADIPSAILSLESTICAMLREQLSSGVSIDALEISAGE